MRETSRCLEFPFQRREASVEWRGSMLPSVCEAVDPRLLKGGWCDSCLPLGPWDLRASQASPVLLAHWNRHSRRQSVQSKQLSWSGRGLDVKQQGCDWELICSFANCLSESELVVPSQLSAIYNNLVLSLSHSLFLCSFLSLSLSLSILPHSTCSSTKTQWRVMPATTIVCCVTTRPRPSSTWSSMCAPWSTSAVRASGSFSACRRACRRRRRTSAPSSPFANALLQIQVRTCPCGPFLSIFLFASAFVLLSWSLYLCSTVSCIHKHTFIHSTEAFYMPELSQFVFCFCVCVIQTYLKYRNMKHKCALLFQIGRTVHYTSKYAFYFDRAEWNCS